MTIVLAIWTFVMSSIGRLIAVGGLALVLGFSQGWSLKAKLDRSATLQAVIAKQNIDLKAAQETAERANTVITELSARDAANEEIISGLQNNRCVLDDAAARRLRQLR